MRVTRTYFPSGDTSTERSIAGCPIFFSPAPAGSREGFAFGSFGGAGGTSISTNWPVACHSSRASSYSVDIRLGNVRRRFLSLASCTFTCGPTGAAGATGIGGLASGMRTAAICFPSFVKSNVATKVANSGLGDTWRGLFVARSVIQMCVASSVCTRYATALLSGDQAAFDTRAFGGIATGLLVPSAADTTWTPTLLLTVSERTRLALKSMKTPPSSWNGLAKVDITTGPSPTRFRNHFLSGLRFDSETFWYLGAVTAAASSGGGVA